MLLLGHACFTALSAPVAVSDVDCLAKHQLGFRFALLEVCGVAVQHHAVSNDISALQAMSGELRSCAMQLWEDAVNLLDASLLSLLQ